MLTHAPHLETERRVLRHFAVDDFDDLTAFWAVFEKQGGR